MQEEENSPKEVQPLQKIFPFDPLTTSYGMGWTEVQAVRYHTTPSREVTATGTPTTHVLALTIRPSKMLALRYGEVKRDRPLPPGSIAVVPAGSSQLVRWQGSKDTLHVFLEPSLVARVAAESFELDPSRSVVPPLLSGFSSPELSAAMLAVDAELRAGGAGGSLLAESFATALAVHLMRYVMGPRRPKASADGILPRHKLRRVVEFIMENLEGSPTLEQMAAVVHLSLYHFSRQFKAATGFAPHQFVIARRIERAQHLLRTNGELGLAEVALRSGFANQGHFCLHFKRIAGVTPRRFRENANGRTILE